MMDGTKYGDQWDILINNIILIYTEAFFDWSVPLLEKW